MEKSGTYAACEQMIEMPFMMMQLSRLDEILERLENNGRLTRREHQSLLELAQMIWHINSSAAQAEFAAYATPKARTPEISMR